VATVPLLVACSASASADPEAAVPWVALQAGDGNAPPLYEAEGRIAQLLVLGDTTLLVREHRSQVAPVAISRTRRQPYAVGRFGGGPGELSYVGAIGLAAGDSLLVLPRMPSMPTNLLSIANGSGRTLVGVASTPQTARDFLSDVRFRAADSIGHIYGMRATATGDDSIAIIRKRLRDGRQETIVWLPTGEPDDARRTTNSVSVSSRGYYQMRNGWAVTGDGRVVLVDVARYAVTVLAPDAQIAASWRIARAGVPVNDSAWTAYRRRAASLNPSLESALRGRTPMPVMLPDRAARDRPRTLPLVALEHDVRSLLFDGDDVWVPVFRSDPPRGEHWERRLLLDGTLRARISLPPRHRLLAVSGRCAIAVRLEADDQEQLVAVPMPPAGDASPPCGW
jgi:hypothetical protein